MSGPDGQCPAETFFCVGVGKTAGETLARPESPLDIDLGGGYTAACAASPARNGLISPTL